MKVHVRTANAEDISAWYGCVPYTMRAMVMEMDGEAVALGGMMRRDGKNVAFMDMREAASAVPFALWKASVRAMKEIISSSRTPVYARVSETLSTAPAFLKRLGFVQLEGNDKVVVRWQTQYPQE